MLRTGFAFASSKSVRVLLPLGFAVLAASALLAYDAVSPRSPGVSVAGEAKMQMLRDEHALIADYLTRTSEARKLADAAADRDVTRMRLMAQGEMQRQAHIDAAEKARKSPAAELKTVALRTPVHPAPARVAMRDVAAAEPLRLAQAPAPQAEQPVQVRLTEGPVRSRLRELAADVRRVPSLLQSAAGWVVDAVPSPRLPSLPGLPLVRQFRAEI